MIIILLSIAISFFITYFTIPVIIFLSRYFNIYDLPDERKVHTRPVSSLGGLGIFAGLVMTPLLLVSFKQAAEFQFFIAAAILIFFIGLKDDLLAISPVKKFAGQAIAALLIVYKGGIQIHSMHGFAGIYELPESFSLLLSIITVIVIINSINLIDGVDGLAGSLVLMASVVLGFYFIKSGNPPYAVLSFSLAGSLIAFLLFNFQPAKIFMGDTGSLLIGTVISILLIKFIHVSASNISFHITSGPAIGFSILIIPLADTLRVFGLRIMHGRSPFSGDRNHIHHILLKLGFSHRMVTIILVGINVLFIGLAYFMRNMGNTYLLLAIISSFFLGVGILSWLNARRNINKNIVTIKKVITMQKPEPKVIILNTELLEEKEIYSLQQAE
ncbi:MAG TPA: MraY family glycosyltransferase, partial [Flavisolibacter sp.]|jgi:UDP-N-acetylmuramyl pentapeptide phosphotransferase/UDP-N-acetylglucosamine-1-phosphate transferase|nr:MraY family glycosyltransferase [Flavisolibacter sp.]